MWLGGHNYLIDSSLIILELHSILIIKTFIDYFEITKLPYNTLVIYNYQSKFIYT